MTADGEGQVMFWRIDRPKQPRGQASFEAGISQLAWSPNDTLVAIGTEAGQVTVWTPPYAKLN